jgi:hypothetical protein
MNIASMTTGHRPVTYLTRNSFEFSYIGTYRDTGYIFVGNLFHKFFNAGLTSLVTRSEPYESAYPNYKTLQCLVGFGFLDNIFQFLRKF